MELHVHVHEHTDQEMRDRLDRIDRRIETVLMQGGITMAKVDELLAELAEINTITNASAEKITEIDADLDDLIARVGEGSLSPAEAEAVKAKITELKATLAAQASTLSEVASQHTPTPPTT